MTDPRKGTSPLRLAAKRPVLSNLRVIPRLGNDRRDDPLFAVLADAEFLDERAEVVLASGLSLAMAEALAASRGVVAMAIGGEDLDFEVK